MKKIYFFVFLFLSFIGFSQLNVTTNQTAQNLANALLGSGVTITSPSLTCPTGANGVFSNGGSTTLGFNNGVILTTGSAAAVNASAGSQASSASGGPAISQMSPLVGNSSTYDGCYLAFQLEPKCNNLSIRYKFGSEEYPEYANTSVNDAFGFFISGPNPLGGSYSNFNMATVPNTSTPISINTINNGQTNSGPCVNCAYYVNNSSSSSIVYDGITTALTASANVVPCSTYTLFLAIVDGGDNIYDSGVFLEQAGINCIAPTITTAGATICSGQSATLTASGVSSYSWSTGATTNTIVVSPTSTTSYTVTGSNIGNCIQDSKVVTVVVNPTPTANAGASATISCGVATTTLNGSGGGSYSWSGPGIVSGANTANPVVGQGGTYSLVVTSAGCSSPPSTVNVVQNGSFPDVQSVVSNTLTCSTLTTTAILSSTTTPVSYAWSGSGIIGATNSETITVNQAGTYNYTVTNTISGCQSLGSVTVPQNTTTPVTTASTAGSITCVTNTITLSSSLAGMNYTWTAPSGSSILAGSSTDNATAQGPGTYTLQVEDPSNNCTYTTTINANEDTAVPTLTLSPSAYTVTCLTNSVQINASSNTPGLTYSWTANGGSLDQPTIANPTATGAGIYDLTVTNPVNGCQASSSATVSADAAVPSASISTSSATLTCTNPSLSTTVTASPSSDLTYSWSPSPLTGANSDVASFDAPGTYVCTITNTVNGCQTTTQISVASNTNVPVASVANNLTITCTTTSVTITTTVTPSSGIGYSWNGPSIIGATNGSSIDVNSGGNYDVTITDLSNGCSATVTATVNSDTVAPTASVSPSTATITCSAPSVSATVTVTSGSNITYNWSPTPLSGATASNADFDAPGTYTCTITNTVNGCFTAAQITVSGSTVSPTINSPASLQLTCNTSTLAITASVTPSAVNYNWSGPSITGATNGSSVTLNGAGNYVLTATDPANGCSSTATTVVSGSNSVPTLSVNSPGTTLTCNVTNINLNAVSNSTAVVWTTPTGTTNTNPLNVASAGIYSVVATDAVSGCTSTQTISITSNTTAPGANAGADITLTCGTVTTNLHGSTSSSNPVNYSWSGPGVVSGGNTSTPAINQPGSYVLTVTDPANGCSSTSSVSVAQGTIDASFTADPTVGTAPLVVNFTNTSTGASGYLWTFGDGNGSTSTNPGNTYINNGTYVVTLYATAGTCIDSAKVTILVQEDFTIEIPNVFTPNGDGANELFTIRTTGAKDVSLQIFNRWGQKLYSADGVNVSWDGKTPSGATAPEGTYFYFVKATSLSDKTVEQHGSVNLFR